MVTLHRLHSYGSLDDVKSEIADTAVQFAQSNAQGRETSKVLVVWCCGSSLLVCVAPHRVMGKGAFKLVMAGQLCNYPLRCDSIVNVGL